jgi:hypothetical protein
MAKQRRLAVVDPVGQAADPARSALAGAIRKAQLASERLVAHKAAIDRCHTQVATAEKHAEAAHAKIATAQDQYADELAQAVASGAATLPTESAVVRAATTKADDADRTAQAVRTALTKLQSELRACEVDVFLADNDVIVAVNSLVAPIAEQMLARGEAARRTLFECAAILNFLRAPRGDPRDDFFWKPGDDWKLSHHAGEKRRAPMAEVSKGIEAFLARFRSDVGLDVHRVLGSWEAARQALKKDAAAALPRVPDGKLD